MEGPSPSWRRSSARRPWRSRWRRAPSCSAGSPSQPDGEAVVRLHHLLVDPSMATRKAASASASGMFFAITMPSHQSVEEEGRPMARGAAATPNLPTCWLSFGSSSAPSREARGSPWRSCPAAAASARRSIPRRGTRGPCRRKPLHHLERPDAGVGIHARRVVGLDECAAKPTNMLLKSWARSQPALKVAPSGYCTLPDALIFSAAASTSS